MKANKLNIAMFSIHSSPTGDLGTKDTGGMSVYVRELAQELGSRGHRVDIYTGNGENSEHTIVALHENVRLIHLCAGSTAPIPKLALYPYLPVFFRDLEHFRSRENLRYDVIHSHYWLSGCLGALAQNSWQTPHMVMFHTLGALKNIAGRGSPEPELRIAVEKRLAKTCSSIVVGASREKENLISYYTAPREKIKVIPCGVNLNRFRPIDRLAARQRLGFERAESIILYVGRFDPLKGLDRLLSAVKHLTNRKQLRLVIVGGDDQPEPSSGKLRRRACTYGIQDKVSFVGRIAQHELPLYYSSANVLVVPSYYESFGLVALESLACGTPVVATPVGAMETIIHEKQTGCVIPDHAPRSLAGGIEAFIPGGKARMLPPDAIRSTVLAFSWSQVADQMLREYFFVIEGQKNRAAHTGVPRCLAYPS